MAPTTSGMNGKEGSFPIRPRASPGESGPGPTPLDLFTSLQPERGLGWERDVRKGNNLTFTWESLTVSEVRIWVPFSGAIKIVMT